jgi:hypothetical protein
MLPAKVFRAAIEVVLPSKLKDPPMLTAVPLLVAVHLMVGLPISLLILSGGSIVI